MTENQQQQPQPGSIRVKVLKASNLPNMAFGQPQNPFVSVQLAHCSDSYARTDVLTDGGQNPCWSDNDNREFELFWDGQRPALLQLRVWNESAADDELIGVGTIDVSEVTSAPLITTLRLREQLQSPTESRGSVDICVSLGPAVRVGLRGLAKLGRVLDVRDSLVHSLCGTKTQLVDTLYRATAGPREFVQLHQKLCFTAAAALAAILVGLVSLTVIVAVPMGFMTLITLPIWFIPALLLCLVSAPLWVPTLAVAVLSVMVLLLTFTVLALTSRPVRKRGAMLSKQIKGKHFMQKIIYADAPAADSA